MRERWKPLRAAMWGAGVGFLVAIADLSAGPPPAQGEALETYVIGVVAGSVIFALVAAVRNWVVRARN
jgi:hypothetical protein